MPTKTWAVGEEVLAADFNTMVQAQVVATFPNAAARDAAITAPTAGRVCYVTGSGLQVHNGTTWTPVASGAAVGMSVAVSATDISNAANAAWGNLDFGTATFQRRIDARASVVGQAFGGGDTQIRLSIMLNGVVVRAFQSKTIVNAQPAESVSVGTIVTVAAGTAGLVHMGIFRSAGTGAFRIIADAAMSVLDGTAWPSP